MKRFQDLQRLPLQLVNSVRGRFQIKFGMTSLLNKGAFTLIELLVVVLIIGILAAVAVPQYQKAVLKTKAQIFAAELLSIRRAIRLYQLENGTSPNLLSDLTSLDTEPVNSNTTRYLGRDYYAISNYFRVYPPIPGTGACDFTKNGGNASCYVHTKQTWNVLNQLKWQCAPFPETPCNNSCSQCFLWK